MTTGHSRYPGSVFDANERARVLIEGINNAKTGNEITVGPWVGFRHFNLSLEERATCPLSCENWDTCFGNGMPVAVRFRYTPSLMEAIEYDLQELAALHPPGFSVRLHILGDFPAVDYVLHWRMWLELIPALHVWGYTARLPDSDIGQEITRLNEHYPDRWVIRTSVADDAPHAPMQVATTWAKPDRFAYDPATQSMVCPQEVGKTPHCATCGICWNPKLRNVRVVFMGHGGQPPQPPRPGGYGPRKTRAKYTNAIPALPPLPSERFTDIDAFIAARGVTRLPAAKAQGVR